ncbi:MAG: DUF3795 domain-containing protein [Chloroflexota bacterium]|nr:DUF3795 domain-containing protein [Chloroflexota bacterium]
MVLAGELDIAGPCGIYCGLCTKYQSRAPSRCLGCRIGEQHSWCSIYRCAVVKRGLVTCVECEEYPCERFARRGWGSDWSSRAAMEGLERVRGAGIWAWLGEQRERRIALERLLDGYNDGRSMSFYCTAATLMPPGSLHAAADEVAAGEGQGPDIKARARAMRAAIEDFASQQGIELQLKKGVSRPTTL